MKNLTLIVIFCRRARPGTGVTSRIFFESCKMAEEEVKDEVMTKEHRLILRKHRKELEDNLQPLKLLSHLTNVLSHEDEEEIRAERTTTEQVRRLLDLLPRRGDQAFEAFVRALDRTQRFLAKPIAEEGKIELANTKDGKCRAIGGEVCFMNHSK